MKIETNVPLPPPRRKYEFIDLKVGESIFVECKKGEVSKMRNVALSATNSMARYRKLNAKFISRAYPDGYRIWRVS